MLMPPAHHRPAPALLDRGRGLLATASQPHRERAGGVGMLGGRAGRMGPCVVVLSGISAGKTTAAATQHQVFHGRGPGK